jgi:hypothetical protein
MRKSHWLVFEHYRHWAALLDYPIHIRLRSTSAILRLTLVLEPMNIRRLSRLHVDYTLISVNAQTRTSTYSLKTDMKRASTCRCMQPTINRCSLQKVCNGFALLVQVSRPQIEIVAEPWACRIPGYGSHTMRMGP